MTAADKKNGSLVKNVSFCLCPFSKTMKSFDRRPLTILPPRSFTVTGTTTKFVVLRSVNSWSRAGELGGEGVAPPSGTVLISIGGRGSEGGGPLSGGAAAGADVSEGAEGGAAGALGEGSGWAGRDAEGASGIFCWFC